MKEFNSLGAFAKHLARTAAVAPVAMNVAVKAGAKVIQHDAKARIGEYQDGIGPYPAWANLAESTVNDRLAKGFTPDDPLLRTGELRDSIEVESEGKVAVVGSVDDVALWQEVGTDKIPPRPFLGPAAIAKEKEVARAVGAVAFRWLCGAPPNMLGRVIDSSEEGSHD